MTTEVRHPQTTRERALALAVPALGLVFAALLLASSTHLSGPSGWYARVLVIVLGVIALVGLIVELARPGRPTTPRLPHAGDHVAVTDRPDLLDAVDDALAATDELEDEPSAPGGLVRVGILVASVIAMVLLANPLGFWLAMAIPVVTALLLLGVRTWWKVALATVLTVAGGYIVFTVLLQVRVPEGILGLL